MPPETPPLPGARRASANWVLAGLTGIFTMMTGLFLADLWGRSSRPEIPLVDPAFLDTAPWRLGYADLFKANEDLSDFDCYACHDKNDPPSVHFDDDHNIIIPEEHDTIVLGHGSQQRNNHCFNCHDQANLLAFYTRDGRSLPFAESSALCGSCHGPTYHDWEGGAHGRTSGYWDRSQGPAQRLDCVNCHDPHSPRIPGRPPAPGPNPLHPLPGAPAHPPSR
jgi:hypothetical protein